MSASLTMRRNSERLLAYETRENLTQAAGKPALDLVCAKLQPSLAMLMGQAGFRALISRALALVDAHKPWPSTVQVKADGTLDGLEQFEAQVGRKEFAEASIILITRLLGLLVTFIGEELTLRLLGEIWPKVTLNAGMITEEEK